MPRTGPPPLPPKAGGGFEILTDEFDSAVAVAPPPRSYRPAADDGDDEDEPRPMKAARRPAEDEDVSPAAGFEVIEEDDEDEDADERVVPRRSEPDEDDEADDRPEPRGRGRKKSPLLLIGGAVAALLLVAGGSVTAYLLWPKKDGSPEVVANGPNADPARPVPAVGRPAGEPPATLTLPGKITDVSIGASGRRLLVHCAAEKKLLVIDSDQRRIEREIPTAGPDTLFAAGKNKFLIVNVKDHEVQRWSFYPVQMEQKDLIVFDGKVKAVSLGCLSDGPALFLTDGPADVWPVHFLNLSNQNRADVGWVVTPPPSFPRDLRFRAAANGSGWVGVSPAAAGGLPGVAIRLEGKRLSYMVPLKAGAKYATLSADGEGIFTGHGRTAFTPGPVPAAEAAADEWYLPDAATGLELVVKAGASPSELVVRVPGRPETLARLTGLPKPAGPESGLTPDQVVVYPNSHSYVAMIPSAADRIEFVPLVLWEVVKKIPDPFAADLSVFPRSFTPGRAFHSSLYAISNRPKPQFSLLSGPPGATLTPDGQLAWQPPSDLQSDRVEFRIQTTAGDPAEAGPPAVKTFAVFNANMPTPVAREPKRPPTKKKPPDPKKSPDPKPMDPVVVAPTDPFAPGAKLANPLPPRVPITPTAVPADRLDVPLGGALRDVCVGGGGRYLIAHVPTGRRLVVFDVSAGKIVKTIGLGADSILFAAGMSKLLVVYPDDKQLLRYSLPDGKLEKDTELDVRPKPVAAAMGSATAGPLILGGPVTQNNAAKLSLTFIDVETLKEVRVDKAEGDLRVGFASAINLRVSADGRTAATWYKQLQPSGLQLIRLAGNTVTGVHKAEGVGHVVPGPHGLAVFTEKGMYTVQGEPAPRKGVVLPAAHGFSFLALADGPGGTRTVSVLGPPGGGDQPVAEFTTLPGFDGKRDPFERDNPTLALDKRLFLVPDANALVVVPPAADRFLVYPIPAAKK